MSKKEQRAVREWVKDGNSVYENPSDAWHEGQVPVEFLTIYREEEYIRQHTKRMSAEEARKFALEYYGWSDDEDAEVHVQCNEPHLGFNFQFDESEELPFQ